MPNYVDGREVLEGDRILMTDAYDEPASGTIASVLEPGTSEADGYGVGKTGGILIELDNGESFTWSDVDSHLIFVERGDQDN